MEYFLVRILPKVIFSSIVKVPGDVPPARIYFFKLSSLAKGIHFANFSPFNLGKGINFANFSPFSLGKGMLFSKFSRFWFGQGYAFWQFRSTKCQNFVIPVKKPKFFQIWSLDCKNLASFVYKKPSLGKGIIFAKIGLSDGAILKLWAAHSYAKFSREPPPRGPLIPTLSGSCYSPCTQAMMRKTIMGITST